MAPVYTRPSAYLSETGSSLLPDEEHQHDKPNLQNPSRYPRLLPRRGRWAAFWQRRGDDTWTWETLCMLLSVLCTIIIAIILKVYEGKKHPSIPGDITLNAMVAALSTISKSSLIFSVSAAIGQIKWDWYEKEPRRLYDLEIFDEASRGPLGAAKLLLTRQIMASLASVGAIILILALAVDPFVQQVVGFHTKDIFVESNEVWTERLTRPSFIPPSHFEAPDDKELSDALNGAIWNDAALYERRAHCPSGNCEFKNFSTFEFCLDTGALTNLNATELHCNVPTFDVLFGSQVGTGRQCTIYFGPSRELSYMMLSYIGLEHETSVPAISRGESYTIAVPTSIISSIFRNVSLEFESSLISPVHHILAMGFVQLSVLRNNHDFGEVKIKGAEWAVITPCKATYTVSVVNGSTSVRSSRAPMKIMRVSKDSEVALGPWTGNKTSIYCWAPEEEAIRNMPKSPIQELNSSEFAANATTLTFCTQHSTMFSWVDLISQRLSGRYFSRKTWVRNPNSLTEFGAWTPFDQGESFERLTSGPGSEDTHFRVKTHTLGAVMEAITAALNNISRARSQEERVPGSVKMSETVVEVRWVWLALPIVLEALGVAFLVAVMFRRRRAAGLWKDSLLAVVYNGLDRQDEALHRENVWRMPDITEAARTTRVKLLIKPTEDGGKVVLASPAQDG